MTGFFRILFFDLIDFLFRGRCYYINSSETLPPPLSREEEDQLMLRLSHGDDDVRKDLIEHNIRLVVYIARKFENTGVNLEDLVSIGTIGLIKAVNTFQPSKKIKLATYASRCIENEILMYLRRNAKTRSEISLDEPLNVDWDGNELLLSDIMGTENDVVFKEIETEVDQFLVNEAVKKLPQRDMDIINMRFGLFGRKELTQKQVAEKMGISQSYISRLEKRIIKKLRKEIQKMV